MRAAGVPAASAPRYAAKHTGDVVHLDDHDRQTSVSIVPPSATIAFEMTVKGHNVLCWPFGSIDEFKAKPGSVGIPLLAPWANRLDEQAFYANGKRYAFDMSLGNVRAPIPIHGFLQATNRWQVVESTATIASAWVTSRLEFFRHPAWIKQWPFAHTIEITYALQDGMLEVRTTIANLSAEPMPVAIGFHPYFQLTDSPRDEWTISVGARTRWLLAANKLPTGETEPIERLIPDPRRRAFADFNLDDVFGDLVRDAARPRDDVGDREVAARGRRAWAQLPFGGDLRPDRTSTSSASSRWRASPTRSTSHIKGVYKELQSVPPGGTWQESFWVKPSGFRSSNKTHRHARVAVS